MTFTQLSYLVALAEHGHFGRAASACHVSQPTLSMQLRKLEDELGISLVDRTLQPIRPTETGERIVEQARLILAERDRIPDFLSEMSNRVEGSLRVGIIPTLSPYLMPLIAGPLADRYPAIDLSVQEMTTEHLIDALADDGIDAGLIATEEERRGLVHRTLFDEPFVAYTASDHPLAEPKELESEMLSRDDLWLLDEGHCLRDQVLGLCDGINRNARSAPVRFRSGSLETLRHLVDHVGGVTLLPRLSILYMDEAARSHVRMFTDPQPSRTVRLICRRGSLKQGLVNAFARVVTETVACATN